MSGAAARAMPAQSRKVRPSPAPTPIEVAAEVEEVAEAAASLMPATAAGNALFDPGPPLWFALLVRAQREVAAERWLALRGVYGFHPVRGARVRRRGRVICRDSCYLPGYVFARFPGWPVVHRVTGGPFVTGAVSRANGEWGVLDPAELQAIHRMRAVDDAIEARRALRRMPRPFTLGQPAQLRHGPLAGQAGEVVEMPTSGRLTLRLMLFSREMLVEVDAEDAIHA